MGQSLPLLGGENRGHLQFLVDGAAFFERLAVAAHQDARAKMESVIAEKTQGLMGGLPLPPGFKLPF